VYAKWDLYHWTTSLALTSIFDIQFYPVLRPSFISLPVLKALKYIIVWAILFPSLVRVFQMIIFIISNGSQSLPFKTVLNGTEHSSKHENTPVFNVFICNCENTEINQQTITSSARMLHLIWST
jgi:hypothetical protein